MIDAKVDKDGAKPSVISGRKACKPRANFDEMPARTHVDGQACTHAFWRRDLPAFLFPANQEEVRDCSPARTTTFFEDQKSSSNLSYATKIEECLLEELMRQTPGQPAFRTAVIVGVGDSLSSKAATDDFSLDEWNDRGIENGGRVQASLNYFKAGLFLSYANRERNAAGVVRTCLT